MSKAKDEVRKIVLGGPGGKSFSRSDRVRSTRSTPDRTHGQDPRSRRQALPGCDVPGRSRAEPELNGVEMISALANVMSRTSTSPGGSRIRLEQEGLPAGDQRRLDSALIPSIRRLQQGSIPRDQFETNYRELAELGNEEPIDDGAVANADKSGKERAEARRTGSQRSRPMRLSLTSDKDVYKVGDTPVFTVISSKRLLPDAGQSRRQGHRYRAPAEQVPAGQPGEGGCPESVPGTKAPFIFKLQDKGNEPVIAICSEKPEVDGIKNDFKKAPLTEVKNITRTIGERSTIRVRPARS